MKRRSVFVCFLAMALMLCACTQQYIHESWSAKNDDAQMASLVARQAAVPYSAPQTAKVQTKTADGKTALNIEAQVEMPKTADIPVLQIEPRVIDQAFVDKLIQVFAKGKTLYEFESNPDIGYYKNFYTIGHTQKLLAEMENELNNPDSMVSKIKGINPDSFAAIKKYLEQMIQEAQAFLDNPDTEAPKVADTSFALKQIDNYNDYPMPSSGMWFEQAPDTLYSIGLGQNEANSFCFSLNRLDYKSYDAIEHYEPNKEDLASVGIGYQKALAQATKIVSDMGADYMDLSFFGKGKYGYYIEPFYDPDVQTDEFYAFVFTRTYNGLSEQIQRGGLFSGGATYHESEMGQLWCNEYIEVCIDKDGLRSVKWQSPSTLLKVVNENVELAPFEQVSKTLEQEGVSYLRSLNEIWIQKPYTDEFKIDRISLGLLKIVDPQEKGKYLLIPSWQLTGAYHVYVKEKDWEWFARYEIGVWDGGELTPHTVYTQNRGQFIEKFALVDYMEINALSANILQKKWF